MRSRTVVSVTAAAALVAGGAAVGAARIRAADVVLCACPSVSDGSRWVVHDDTVGSPWIGRVLPGDRGGAPGAEGAAGPAGPLGPGGSDGPVGPAGAHRTDGGDGLSTAPRDGGQLSASGPRRRTTSGSKPLRTPQRTACGRRVTPIFR